MKTIVRILMTAAAVMMLANFANAQNDHRCVSTVGTQYQADGVDVGGTYSWVVTDPSSNDVTGSVITAGAGTTVITTSWPATAGVYTIELTETIGSCSEVFTFTVELHAKPTTTIVDATTVICNLDDPTVEVTFAGNQPFNFTYDINGTTTDVNAHDGSPYTINLTDVSANTTVTVTAVSDLYCGDGTNTGTAQFNVQTFGTTGISVVP